MSKKEYHIVTKYCFEKETDDMLHSYSEADLIGHDNYFADGIPVIHDIYKSPRGFRGTWAREASPLRIELLEEYLAEIKKKGGTHVEIDYHQDHDSYNVYGLEKRLATPEEVEKYETKRKKDQQNALLKKFNENKKKLAELEKQLEKFD